jgi:signal peptidase
VFKITGRDVPIVHRILRRHARTPLAATNSSLLPPVGPLPGGVGDVDYLTKGDNNNIDDRNLYATGQLWLSRGEIVGRAVAYAPYAGMVTILLNDYPALKFVLIGLMGLFVLTGKEA